jgi:site-specific recombinase XerD
MPDNCSGRTADRASGRSAAWDDGIEAYRERIDDGRRSPETVATYVKHVGWLADDVGGDPWELGHSALSSWLDDHNWSAHTRRKVLVSLRGFYVYGVHEGLCARSPLAGLSAVPPRRRGPNRMVFPDRWQEPVQSYLDWLEAGARRSTTADQRRWWLLRLAETYADPWAVTVTDLSLWLSRTDLAPQTKRLGRSSVRTFYQWAETTGRVERSPARDLPSVIIPRALPRPMPDDVLTHAIQAADDRTRLILLVAMYSGLRRAEIAGLHSRDIGDDGLHVLGKGGHERVVPIHADLRLLLRAEFRRRRSGASATGWTADVAADGYLFPSDRHAGPITPAHLAKLVSVVLPAGWTMHTIRHRFASRAYAEVRDLRAVQELMGHAKPETTAIYAAVPNGALTTAVAGVGLRSVI